MFFLVLVFLLIQNLCHDDQYHCEKAIEANSRNSAFPLVADSTRLQTSLCYNFTLDQEDLVATPLEGPKVQSSDQPHIAGRNGGQQEGQRRLAMSLVSGYERKARQSLSQLRRALARCERGLRQLIPFRFQKTEEPRGRVSTVAKEAQESPRPRGKDGKNRLHCLPVHQPGHRRRKYWQSRL